MSYYNCKCQMNWLGKTLLFLGIIQWYPCRTCLHKQQMIMADEYRKYGRYLMHWERYDSN